MVEDVQAMLRAESAAACTWSEGELLTVLLDFEGAWRVAGARRHGRGGSRLLTAEPVVPPVASRCRTGRVRQVRRGQERVEQGSDGRPVDGGWTPSRGGGPACPTRASAAPGPRRAAATAQPAAPERRGPVRPGKPRSCGAGAAWGGGGRHGVAGFCTVMRTFFFSRFFFTTYVLKNAVGYVCTHARCKAFCHSRCRPPKGGEARDQGKGCQALSRNLAGLPEWINT